MKTEEINADKLCKLWDDGFENGSLDPCDVFNKTINYCEKLERKILQLSIPETQPVTMADVNRPGLKIILMNFCIIMYGYSESTAEIFVDKFLKTLDNKQAEADEDYRKHGRAT
jgi:hypothetical protein